MPSDLEMTIDKFTFRVPADRYYSKDGIWTFLLPATGRMRIRVGLTDYMQQHSGDVAFVTAKPVGTKLSAGEDFADVETMKTALELQSPVTGTVTEVNQGLDVHPELVNQDPYGKGWILEIEPDQWEADCAKLLDPPAYFSLMKSQVEMEKGS